MAAVLLVVDVQTALVDYLERERRTEFLATLEALIEGARNEAVPVVYVRHGDEELRPGTSAWGIAREIAPQVGEPIVDKRFRDAFRETDLAEVLARIGADHLIVCGMQTEFCVDATIREADRRGYKVTLVADGHATFPVDGTTEAQIRDQVHRVAAGSVAAVVPSSQLFVSGAPTIPV